MQMTPNRNRVLDGSGISSTFTDYYIVDLWFSKWDLGTQRSSKPATSVMLFFLMNVVVIIRLLKFSLIYINGNYYVYFLI